MELKYLLAEMKPLSSIWFPFSLLHTDVTMSQVWNLNTVLHHRVLAIETYTCVLLKVT